MPMIGDTWFRPGSQNYAGQAYARGMADREAAQSQASSASQQQIGNQMIESARIQADAMAQAAAAQAAAAQQSIAWQKEQYAKNEANISSATTSAVEGLNPWRESGLTALGELTSRVMAGPGEYTQSPGYEARLAEGQRAIERSAAARGGALSGRAVKEATRYGQEFATQDYDNFLRRYYESLAPYETLSGMGANAAQQMGQYRLQGASALAGAGQNTVNQMQGAAIYGGEATAAGIANSANIMAAQQQAIAERDTAYNAFRAGSAY